MNYAGLLTLKRIDTYGQLVIAISPVVVALAGGQKMFSGMFAFYALVGSWQLLSALITWHIKTPECIGSHRCAGFTTSCC